MVHNFIDMLGARIGYVTVLSRAYPNNMRKDAYWHCQCDCGNEKIFTGSNLRSGSIKSCGQSGCKYNKNRKYITIRDTALGYFYVQYKNGARNRQLLWDITFDIFCTFIRQPCYYCNGKTIYTLKIGAKNNDYRYVSLLACGIDRIDNNIAYIPLNCIPCCATCNRAKGELTQIAFITMCKTVAERH